MAVNTTSQQQQKQTPASRTDNNIALNSTCAVSATTSNNIKKTNMTMKPTKKNNVSFGDDVEIRTTTHFLDMTVEERRSYWFKSDEIWFTRNQVKIAASKEFGNNKKKKKKQQQPQQDSNDGTASSTTTDLSTSLEYSCARGVIEHTTDQLVERHRIRKKAKYAVLLEQQYQQRRGIYNPERLAACYKPKCLPSQILAEQVGSLDYQKVYKEKCQCIHCRDNKKKTFCSNKGNSSRSSLMSFFLHRGRGRGGNSNSRICNIVTKPSSGVRVQPVVVTTCAEF